MSIGFYELRSFVTQFQDCIQATAIRHLLCCPHLEVIDFLGKSIGINSTIGVPDVGLDFPIKVFHPLATVTDLDEGMQKAQEDSDFGKQGAPS